ncbi:hypothetical protein NS201_15455 [Pseudomonas oryzihabitans]|nr:hypothetical protein NS201_15455 [Pseudomonas psychrotolerans]KTT33675.1 hypothetical protein SB9_12700 [Pseudomonas psychrotolerans]
MAQPFQRGESRCELELPGEVAARQPAESGDPADADPAFQVLQQDFLGQALLPGGQTDQTRIRPLG